MPCIAWYPTNAFSYAMALFMICSVRLSGTGHQKDKENLLGPQLSKEGLFLPPSISTDYSSVSLPSKVRYNMEHNNSQQKRAAQDAG